MAPASRLLASAQRAGLASPFVQSTEHGAVRRTLTFTFGNSEAGKCDAFLRASPDLLPNSSMMAQSEKQNTETKRWWWPPLFGMIVVGGLGLGVMYWWKTTIVDAWAGREFTVREHEDVRGVKTDVAVRNYAPPGAFGDAFAPVASFFSSLALGAAIASLLAQHKELKNQSDAARDHEKAALQREREFADQVAVLKKQVDVLGAQVKQQERSNKLAQHMIDATVRAHKVAEVAARVSAAAEVTEIDRQGIVLVTDIWDSISQAPNVGFADAWFTLTLEHEHPPAYPDLRFDGFRQNANIVALLAQRLLLQDLVRTLN